MATAASLGTQSSSLPTGPSSPPSSIPLWDGDKMFNVYIYDYCRKRGYFKTANEFLEEAGIAPDLTPPIDAKQGLLFEWWSVFWVLFTAKSSGTGSEDALLYNQHQVNQAAQRQSVQRMAAQVPTARYINPARPTLGHNGGMPNGVGPGLQQNSMQVGGQPPAPFQMGVPGNQMNGIGGPPTAPGSAASQPPNLQQVLSGQRTNMPPQRQGGLPFQSPNMADSSHNIGTVSGQQSMGQLGPSQNMASLNRGMHPPNGPQGMVGIQATGMGGGQSALTPSSMQNGRPPSRTATPGHMMQASPSMANRQPPGLSQQMDPVTTELARLNSTGQLNSIKQEVGIPPEKDLAQMTVEEKNRIFSLVRQRSRSVKPGQPGPGNAIAGPSGSNGSMQPPNHHVPPQQAPNVRPNKRNSTSPGDEHGELPSSDSSPPDRKRLRTSPEQTPLTLLNYPQAPQGIPSSQSQMPNGMMRGPMPGQPTMGGFPTGMANMGNLAGNPGMNMQSMGQMGVQHMSNALSPAMGHQQGNMLQSQMREYQYRQTMQNMHKTQPQGGVMPGGAGPPASGELPFNQPGAPSQGTPPFSGALSSRMLPNKSMLPPPSPAINGVQKDQNSQLKDAKTGMVNGHPDGSPRNAPIVGQNAQVTSTAPATPIPTPSQVMPEPSPSAMLNAPSSTMVPTGELFSSDFIQSVASSLDEFGSDMFRADAADFERDFAQWINPDDVTL